MTAQRLATQLDQTDTTVSNSRPAVSTTLFCDKLLLRTELQHILSGIPLTIAEGFSAAWPTLVSRWTQEPALVIFAANQLPTDMLNMVQWTKERFPATRIVVLADRFDLSFVRRGRNVGVNGFCLTGSNHEVLITSLELVRLGELVLPPTLIEALLDEVALVPDAKPSDPKLSSISAREAAILTCLMEGASNKVIARQLDLAEETVKAHLKAIHRKIGVANRPQAAIWAAEHLP